MSTCIVCNPGCGNGPYLRCAEVAVRVAARLPRRPPIIMPLLYGERQKRILSEEHGDTAFVFDKTLGDIIRAIGYDGGRYGDALERWLREHARASATMRTHIRSTYGNEILEIARAPLMHIGGTRSYATLFARISDILNRASSENEVGTDHDLLRRAAVEMRYTEEQFTLRFITQPGTFAETHPDDREVPLTASMPRGNFDIPKPSIYVSLSGISGNTVSPLFDQPVYCNAPERMPGSLPGSPGMLTNANIVLHVARAGWGAAWNSLLCGVPLVMTPYDPQDDPEILFNMRRIEELGIGIPYRREPFAELSEYTRSLVARMRSYRDLILERFKTLNGADIVADKIVQDWMSSGPKP